MASGLGTHNYREQNGAKALLVLVIRGELLNRRQSAGFFLLLLCCGQLLHLLV